MYKREEDGIVLVDQDRCRGWRMCVSGCPYKKVYFNHRTGKAEKCTLCFPRIEVGLPTVCSETCVGRLRYLGLVLYDADKVSRRPLRRTTRTSTRRSVGLPRPERPRGGREARARRHPRRLDRRGAALAGLRAHDRHRVALPLHPEYRTMPMVWYIPPLSPVVDVLADTGYDDAEDALFAAIDALRIRRVPRQPVHRWPGEVRAALGKLAVMRR